jgi:hypothetical protein
MTVSPEAERIMAQFLRPLFDPRQQSFQSVNDSLSSHAFAVSDELPALAIGFLTALAPSEAYGADWLIR